VLWGARVLCWREVACQVLSEHGIGSGDPEDKLSLSLVPPFFGVTHQSR